MTAISVDGADEDQERSALQAVLARLHHDFDHVVGSARVEHAWEAACHRFAGSRIRAFVPILAERRAVKELRTASAPGQPPDPVEEGP
ncbi:hypothetical protein DN069_01870 [Streptacidiphilus pinicola]|uniref:Uncharacterized protein n=1 Tax=Streptacidiphilus pinicola TaxID=2219663 RepID=A0A2X0KK15_9ACTN|nr:hypothetical protein [Streptacidiphilus pinicola]RAG87299.1 hypothetical protein DN069_01870 [Streptacidiphilus pinicola]